MSVNVSLHFQVTDQQLRLSILLHNYNSQYFKSMYGTTNSMGITMTEFKLEKIDEKEK